MVLKGKPASQPKTSQTVKPVLLPDDAYHRFLLSKIKFAEQAGFDIEETDINPLLKPHQKAIVRWAVQGGRRAIFAAFGLGKTFMQIEVLRLISKCVDAQAKESDASPALALITCPLGVRQEFIKGGHRLGEKVSF